MRRVDDVQVTHPGLADPATPTQSSAAAEDAVSDAEAARLVARLARLDDQGGGPEKVRVSAFNSNI